MALHGDVPRREMLPMTVPSNPALSLLGLELGIPRDYGHEPFLPWYAEARDLVEVENDIFGRPQKLAPDTAADWQRLRTAAAVDGVELRLVSGFRGYDYQATLIRNKLRRGLTIADILRVNAAPGYSQHHTGRALDLTCGDEELALTERFEDTSAFAWLLRRASEFAFCLPYPRGNRFGFCYEPWHWSQLNPDDFTAE
jgi:D-alanyl-D-alanine carboxypeptidase